MRHAPDTTHVTLPQVWLRWSVLGGRWRCPGHGHRWNFLAGRAVRGLRGAGRRRGARRGRTGGAPARPEWCGTVPVVRWGVGAGARPLRAAAAGSPAGRPCGADPAGGTTLRVRRTVLPAAHVRRADTGTDLRIRPVHRPSGWAAGPDRTGSGRPCRGPAGPRDGPVRGADGTAEPHPGDARPRSRLRRHRAPGRSPAGSPGGPAHSPKTNTNSSSTSWTAAPNWPPPTG